MHRILALALLFSTICPPRAAASDWPQFRYDAGRTAASPDDLPEELELLWKRELPTPRPAFPKEVRLAFDASYEPVAASGMLFVPSMVDDSVTAYDAETGLERWRFVTDGPVRFAPAAWNDSLYFVSDDGCLYCVDAADGALRWKYRGLPTDLEERKVLGHGRLISLVPARGGPVLADGVVYFAAGLWPSEGVFVHALDAVSGEPVWSNTSVRHIPESNWDHGVGHYSGLTPQGYLAIVGDKLVVPCGAQLPAFLDLKTGELDTYTMGWGGRFGLPKGCWFVAGRGRFLSTCGDLYDISRPNNEQFAKTKPGESDFKSMLYPGACTRLDIERANQRELDSFRKPVFTPDVLYESDLDVVARDLTNVSLREIAKEDLPPHRAEDPYPDTMGGEFREIWRRSSDLDVQIKAGDRLYLAGPGVVEALDVGGDAPRVAWSKRIDGEPSRVLAADEKLFVVTTDGTILAFGAPRTGEAATYARPNVSASPEGECSPATRALLHAVGPAGGYALVLGLDDGRLVEELVQGEAGRPSNLDVIAIDDDPVVVTSLQKRLHDAGLYGSRATVLLGDPATYPLPPFFASVVVSETPQELLENADERELLEAVFHVLRPYGGAARLSGLFEDRDRIEQLVDGPEFPSAIVENIDDDLFLTRSGSLPGAADWSHDQANAACTGASQDDFIRSPMTLLWFDASDRWHKFPGQDKVRVSRGRLVLLNEGELRASDVFTGRELWKADVPIGEKSALNDPDALEVIYYERHRTWGPPASLPATTQFVVVEDAIYLSDGPTLLVFDPATGHKTGEVRLPEDLHAPWTHLRVAGERLVGVSDSTVVCVDRRSGMLLWRVEAERADLSLAVGHGKVFFAELANSKRGENPRRDGRLCAIDIATGEMAWEKPGGARLRYSPTLDIVVTPFGFRCADDGEPIQLSADPPPGGFVVKGSRLPDSGMPAYLAGDKLLTGNEQTLRVFAAPSGEPIGEPMDWFRRGCTGTRASTHLLTTRFRGNSAWIDLETREITPLLGVRPGCSVNNNLYPADGLLNIPNLTAGCTCNYAPVSAACIPAEVLRGRNEN